MTDLSTAASEAKRALAYAEELATALEAARVHAAATEAARVAAEAEDRERTKQLDKIVKMFEADADAILKRSIGTVSELLQVAGDAVALQQKFQQDVEAVDGRQGVNLVHYGRAWNAHPLAAVFPTCARIHAGQ